MDEIGWEKACLVSDATSAALRKQMEWTNNTLVTLSDEYRATLSSLNIGEVSFMLFAVMLIVCNIYKQYVMIKDKRSLIVVRF